eukprot:TRINITY_DN8141_c0_g1_i1.p1 TRINITY_DN8141_c0_g1~~TRINITY_DN8141_c0_g1_i1.p1  ORF type:complete len:334 (-),score=97.77 TRINITY_DN8141_c0_g1_i1:116-1117(-)
MEDILSPEFEDPSGCKEDLYASSLSQTVETLDITDVEDWSPLEGVEGIEKRVLDAGVELSGIGENDIALCHYSFTIEGDLEPFDSSLLRCKRERLQLGSLLPGVELALRSMKKAERSAFRIQPYLAYGAIGCPPRIPGNSVILADIKIFDFMDSKSSKELLRRPHELVSKYSFTYIYELVHREYLEANGKVKRREFTSAYKTYESGIRLLEIVPVGNDSEDNERKKLLHKLRLNVGLCYLQSGKYPLTCESMHQVLSDEPNNLKALYRMGKAKRMLGNIENARTYLKKAHALAPRDPDICRELGDLKKDIALRKQYEKTLAEGMSVGKTTSSQ